MERGNEADVGERGRWLDRLRAGSHGESGAAAGSVGRQPSSRFIAPLAFLVVVATTALRACSGWCWPSRPTTVSRARNRKSLRGAIEALQVVSPDVSRLDPALIRALERASGLKDLRFDHDPPGGGREVQSLLDANGRIVGWFSWDPERPATALLASAAAARRPDRGRAVRFRRARAVAAPSPRAPAGAQRAGGAPARARRPRHRTVRTSAGCSSALDEALTAAGEAMWWWVLPSSISADLMI